MGDEQRGLARLPPDRLQLLLQQFPGLGVERAERLVHQHDVGIEREQPRQRDALLHAAAELAGIEIGEARKMHEIEIVGGLGDALGPRQSLHLERPSDVLDGGEPGKQRELLEHHAAIGAGWPDRGAVEAQFAAARRLEAADDVQERALAAAGRAHDGNELVLVDGQRQAIDGGDAPVLDRERLVEIAHLQQRHRRGPRPRSRPHVRSVAPDLGFTRDRALQEDASRVNPTCVRRVSKHERHRQSAIADLTHSILPISGIPRSTAAPSFETRARKMRARSSG